MPETMESWELDTARTPPAGWLDRRRDLAGYLLTPLITLVFAPTVAGTIGAFLLAAGLLEFEVPELCETAVLHNDCEETTLQMIGEHVALFAGVWLALWLPPWWRGLRAPRIALAVVACAVLVAAPLRMTGHVARTTAAPPPRAGAAAPAFVERRVPRQPSAPGAGVVTRARR